MIKSCFECLNLKPTKERNVVGCEIKKFKRIYYPEFKHTLREEFRQYASQCENYLKPSKFKKNML